MNKVSKLFEDKTMNEDEFWGFIDDGDWKDSGYDYDKAKLSYLKKLTPEQGTEFRILVDELYNMLDSFVNGRYEGMNVGDDSYSDLLNHIIGLGKNEYIKNLKSLRLIKARANARYESDEGYAESFSYAVPYDEEWQDIPKAIKEVEESIARRNARDHKAIEIDENIMDIDDVISKIAENLADATPEYITEVYNNICFNDIEYVEDSVWKVKEDA